MFAPHFLEGWERMEVEGQRDREEPAPVPLHNHTAEEDVVITDPPEENPEGQTLSEYSRFYRKYLLIIE